MLLVLVHYGFCHFVLLTFLPVQPGHVIAETVLSAHFVVNFIRALVRYFLESLGAQLSFHAFQEFTSLLETYNSVAIDHGRVWGSEWGLDHVLIIVIVWRVASDVHDLRFNLRVKLCTLFFFINNFGEITQSFYV